MSGVVSSLSTASGLMPWIVLFGHGFSDGTGRFAIGQLQLGPSLAPPPFPSLTAALPFPSPVVTRTPLSAFVPFPGSLPRSVLGSYGRPVSPPPPLLAYIPFALAYAKKIRE